MKPLLIIPPATEHWSALDDLIHHKGPPWLRDIEARLTHGVDGAQDAYAVIPDGGRFLACACINKHNTVGILGHVYTRPEFRRRGYARALMETLLAWFEMMGGQDLYLGTTSELDETLYRKFGFTPLNRAVWAPYDRLTMRRRHPRTPEAPYANLSGDISVRPLTRADWPELMRLLQHRDGPDPRVPLAESAVSAELFGLDLIDHAEDGTALLLGSVQGGRVTGVASIATDSPPPHTYALLIPHTGTPAALRSTAVFAAQQGGYTDLRFPMESLDKLPAWAAAGKPEPETDEQKVEPPPVE